MRLNEAGSQLVKVVEGLRADRSQATSLIAPRYLAQVAPTRNIPEASTASLQINTGLWILGLSPNVALTTKQASLNSLSP